MRRTRPWIKLSLAVVAALLVLGTGLTIVTATDPCGDFGECIVLIEINATDGDIGFHFLADGDDLVSTQIDDPNGAKVFENSVKGPLRKQTLTETFGESAEPPCWAAPDADPDEIVTLEEFLGRWAVGTYVFTGKQKNGGRLIGQTQLSHKLPAAPQSLTFNGTMISWTAGSDLGNCADSAKLAALVAAGVLPMHPANVPVGAWEVVLEPDVEDGNPLRKLKFTIRVPGSIAPKQVTVPAQYLASLPLNTPVKIEVGAIGVYPDANATFTEADGFCVNESGAGCE